MAPLHRGQVFPPGPGPSVLNTSQRAEHGQAGLNAHMLHSRATDMFPMRYSHVHPGPRVAHTTAVPTSASPALSHPQLGITVVANANKSSWKAG